MPARIQPKTSNQTEASLQNLYGKKQEVVPLREAMEQMRSPLKAALVKGYTYRELADMLWQQGISVSVSTLRTYLSDSQKTSKRRVANQRRSSQPKDSLERSSSTVEVFIPSRSEISSYTVGRDFWATYQESLKEREEVYRRLAES